MKKKNPSLPEVLDYLGEIQHLMTLAGENPFKIRAFEKARASLEGVNDLVERARKGSLTELPGIGKGISEVLTDYLLHGKTSVRDELIQSLPPGLMDLTRVPGLGPKKAKVLIEELGIRTLGELEYACGENRLIGLTGFGEKAQAKILEGVRFLLSTRGQARFGDVWPVLPEILKEVREALGTRVELAGEVQRHMEVVSGVDLMVELPDGNREKLKKKAESLARGWDSNRTLGLPLRVHFSESENFGFEWVRISSSEAHWAALGRPKPFQATDEVEFYAHQSLPIIPAEMRETGEEVQLARKSELKKILDWDGIRGVFHNHTTASDGRNSLEEMVRRARDLGYEYIGISDHSQSAYYAHGLKPADLRNQEKEIRNVQEKYPEIRIFWGVESDILLDGSLDYEDSILKRFDFVVASIHSRFKSDRKEMTDRIVSAIRNPYTRFVGHLTGRLLLGRAPYEIDIEKIIQEAARHDVAIEINANPQRLDIDWRLGPALRASGTKVSVNPDAHDLKGLEDTSYGIGVARKALLPTSLVVNSASAEEVHKWLARV